jgi:hypothetical protein
MIEDGVSPEDWAEIIATTVQMAKAGDWRAREWLGSYVAGGRPLGELDVDVNETVQVVVWPSGWEPPQLPPAEPMPTDSDIIDGEARELERLPSPFR